MDCQKTVRAIAWIVMAAGIIVMIGWILNIAVLKSISPNWITMKFTTALCFFLSGTIVYFVAEFQKDGHVLETLVLPIVSMQILMIMGVFLVATVFGIRTGIENLFVKEITPLPQTVAGVPSVMTMINFILIAGIGMLTAFYERVRKEVLWIGALIAGIGALALIGYIVDVPVLYYSIYGLTPMAIHTALLFMLIGGAFMARANKEEASKNKDDAKDDAAVRNLA